MTEKKPISWAGAALVATGIVAFAGVLIVVVFSAGKKDRNEECRFHLMKMWMAIGIGNFTETPEWDPFKGRQFWDRHGEWPTETRVKTEIERIWMICPEFGQTKPGPGVEHIDYRGPARGLRSLGDKDPLAADRPDNHVVGGNVILKSGILVSDSASWSLASKTTSD